MNIAETYLEARNPAIGCARAYKVTLTRDLFGVFMVETRYGKIGTSGHALAYSFEEEDRARAFMETCLRRRQSAPKRIGVAYATIARFDLGQAWDGASVRSGNPKPTSLAAS